MLSPVNPTLTQASAPTHSRRRTGLGLVFAAIVLGSTLTACGGGTELDTTTCGELKEKSSDEVFQLIQDAADEEGGEDAEEAAALFESVPDDQRDPVAESFVEQVCGSEDDDVELQDTEFAN